MNFAKLFGLFPININCSDPREIAFSWRSIRTAFSSIFILGSFLSSLAVLKIQVQKGPLTAANIIGIVFFGTCCIGNILLFKIAQKWRILIMRWMATESDFTSDWYQLPVSSWSLRKRLLVCTVVYIVFLFLEHTFFLSSEIVNLTYELKACNRTDSNVVEIFITRQLSFVLESVPFGYSYVTKLFFEYLNFSYTFVWNFLDLFIILISMGIAFLYEKANRRLQTCKGLLINEEVWAEIRAHHVKIRELLKLINDSIGEMVVFVCCVDGYFILLQLLNITK